MKTPQQIAQGQALAQKYYKRVSELETERAVVKDKTLSILIERAIEEDKERLYNIEARLAILKSEFEFEMDKLSRVVNAIFDDKIREALAIPDAQVPRLREETYATINDWNNYVAKCEEANVPISQLEKNIVFEKIEAFINFVKNDLTNV